jgi:hypothetical protein
LQESSTPTAGYDMRQPVYVHHCPPLTAEDRNSVDL